MSGWFAGWFTGNASETNSKAQAAVQRSSETAEALHKKIKHLEAEIQKCIREALAHKKKKDMSRARTSITRKRLLENQLQQLQGQLLNLERQKFALENNTTTKVVFDAMKNGTEAMKNVQKDLSVEQVEDLATDFEEQMMDADEINTALSRPMGDMGLMDEEELDNELDMLEELPDPNENQDIVLDQARLEMPNVPMARPRVEKEERKNRNTNKLQKDEKRLPTKDQQKDSSKHKVKLTPKQLELYKKFQKKKAAENMSGTSYKEKSLEKREEDELFGMNMTI